MKKKNIIILGTVIVLGGGGLGAMLMPKGLEAEVITVSPHDVKDTFTEDGIVKQGENSTIISQVDGTVIRLLVKPNQHINAGDPIAVIDSKDYNYQIQNHQTNISAYKAQIEETRHTEQRDKADMTYSISELKQKLKSAAANKKISDIKQIAENSPEEYVNLLGLNLQVAQNNYDLSSRNLDQLKALYDIGAASQDEIQKAENNCTTQKAALTRAKTQYDASKTQLNHLKKSGITSSELNAKFYALQDESLNYDIAGINDQIAALEHKLGNDYSTDAVNRLNALIDSEQISIRQLQDKIKDCTITASVSGYITDLPVQNLHEVSQGTALATIKPQNELTISCDVLTTCEPYLKVGDLVTLKQKLKSEDITYPARIKEIYAFAKESTSALGLKEYRVETILSPDDANIPLKDGYELEATFTTFTSPDALTVPNSAVFTVDDQDYVYVLKNNKAAATAVKVSHKTNTDSVIESGVSKGDTVIYNANTEGLADGTLIKPTIKKDL